MDPLDEICENESRLYRYVLDYVASPAPVTEKCVRALLHRNLLIERAVLAPLVSSRGLGVAVFGDSASLLRELQDRLSAGRTKLSEVADALLAVTSRRALQYRSFVSPTLREELSDTEMAQLALFIAPFGDDYHVSA